MTAGGSDPYVVPLSSDAVIRQTRRLMQYLSQTQTELERFVTDLERNEAQARGESTDDGRSTTIG